MLTAIITGGAVRLGKALACHLADQGWIGAGNHVVVVNTGSLFKYFRRPEVDELAR